MRGIRGYIISLANGGGPPTGTVDVSAKPLAKPANLPGPVEINLTTHRLGRLDVLHQPGSSDPTRADNNGFFGWDMELSPGKIDLDIRANEPEPTQYHKRFHNESAQIGKGFISDIERLGWAGGKDALIWDGVFGGHKPTSATWTSDPALSWDKGNWSIDPAGFATPGRVTIRKGIAMLGGVVFSVELGDLVIPVTGDDPIPPNPGPGDRWDLICLRMDWNPDSPEYGKQSFDITRGVPGQGIPPFPGNIGNYRCLPLHAVRMKAGVGTYDTGSDFRPWLNPPPGVTPSPLVGAPIHIPAQFLNTGNNDSPLNTALNTNALTLAPGCAWDGTVTLRFQAIVTANAEANQLYAMVTSAGITSAGSVVSGQDTNYPIACLNEGNNPYPRVLGHLGIPVEIGVSRAHPITVTFPLRRIPAYFSGSTLATDSRTWNKLRFAVQYFRTGGPMTITDQSLAYHLWPVT